jgi:hypothetical protein
MTYEQRLEHYVRTFVKVCVVFYVLGHMLGSFVHHTNDRVTAFVSLSRPAKVATVQLLVRQAFTALLEAAERLVAHCDHYLSTLEA